MLTPRGVWALLASVPLLVAGRIGNVEILVALALALLMLVVLCAGVSDLALAGRRDRRPRVLLASSTPLVGAGYDALVEIRITNPGRRRLDRLALTGTPSAPAGARHGLLRPPTLLPAIEAGGHIVLTRSVPCPQRGRAVIGPVRVWRMDPFGLSGHAVATSDTATCLVHPPAGELDPARTGLADMARAEAAAACGPSTFAVSDEVAGVRSWRAGEPLHRLHWPSTARSGRLLARTFDRTVPAALTLCLDTRASVHSPASFEEALRATAAISCGLARRGRPVRIVTADGALVAPVASDTAELELLAFLALAEPARRDRLVEVLSGCAREGRQGIVAVSTLCGLAVRIAGMPDSTPTSGTGAPPAPALAVDAAVLVAAPDLPAHRAGIPVHARRVVAPGYHAAIGAAFEAALVPDTAAAGIDAGW